MCLNKVWDNDKIRTLALSKINWNSIFIFILYNYDK